MKEKPPVGLSGNALPSPGSAGTGGTGLEVRSLSVDLGRRRVVADAGFVARPGQVTVIVGHNGAGKTTLLRSVAGLLQCSGGQVILNGQDVSEVRVAGRARRGIALVPDGAHGVFPDMSVADNLQLSGVCSRQREAVKRADVLTGLVQSLFSSVLIDRRKQLAASLSGGQRQMLAIAVALARGPAALLLDEPSLGLAPVLTEQVLRGVREAVTRTGISCVLVEQNVGIAMQVADALLVLKEGRVAATFAASELPALPDLWQLF